MAHDVLAAGTNQRFSHTHTTTGTPDAIWGLWTNPASWANWDDGLKSATMTGGFTQGATGKLTPLKGPDASFEIVSLDHGVSYEFATKMPGARLHVLRELTEEEPTTFRHTVWFAGPLSWLWSRLYGKQFRTALPPTMRKLGDQAASR